MSESPKKYMDLKDLFRPKTLTDYSTPALEKLLSEAHTDPKKFEETLRGLQFPISQDRIAKYKFPSYLTEAAATPDPKLLLKPILDSKAGTGGLPEPAFNPFEQKNLLDFKNLLNPRNPTDPQKFAELKNFLKPLPVNNATPLLEPLKEKAWGVVKSVHIPSPEIYENLRKLWWHHLSDLARAASRVIAAFVFLLSAAAALIYCSLNVPPDCFIQEFSDALATGILIFVATPFIIKLAEAQKVRLYVRWILVGVSLIFFVTGYLVGETRESGNAPLYFSALRTILVELAVACIVLAGLELLLREYVESYEDDLGRAWTQLITAGGRLTQ